jgi:ABC-type phosphate transport system substrate-binding protein
MLKNTKVRLGVVAAAAAAMALVVGAATPAMADPATGTFKSLSGVGSDTIQDVMNGMGSQIPAIGSYDAVDPVTLAAGGNIQTKSTGPTFVRPNGSGQGVAALSDSIQGGTHLWNTKDISGQVDFARSSSGPAASGTALTYIPFAQDAVSYAVNVGSDFPRNLPLGSSADPASKLSLYNIYHCIKTTYTNTSLQTVAIHPLVPQAGSGTRSFWLGKMGLTEGDLSQANFCVKDTNTDGTSVQEHDGTTLTDPGDIVPFSISQYIAQGNHKAVTTAYGVNLVERKGQAALGAVNGVLPIRMSAGKTIANGSFPINRLVYNVVDSTRAANASDPINTTFVGASSAVCSQGSLITAFGFSTIANCGATTIQGPFTA